MQTSSLVVLGLLLAGTGSTADISQQIAELMFHAPGTQPGYRPVHAKGIVCKGAFTVELSDDPLPRIRSRVYALSVAHRYTK